MAEFPSSRALRTTLDDSLHGLRPYLHEIGPGLITGASDDDPSCIGTLAQTGAAFGYLQLWVTVLAFPLMGVIQEICSRIGLETGRGLAENIHLIFPKPVLYLAVALVCIANTITLGADLGAMAAALKLLLGIPFVLGLVTIPMLSILLQIFCSYERCMCVLRLLALSLIGYVIVVSTLVGTVINLLGINPMQALYYAAVINGITAPLLLAMVMRVGSSRAIMKDRANSRLSNVLGW